MKNLTLLFLALFIFIGAGSSALFAQGAGDDERVWSRIVVDPNGPVKVETDPNWVPADQNPRYYDFGTGIVVSPNYRPHPTTNTTQSEMSVDVHPTNESIIFASANATPNPVSTIWGTGVYWSLDGAGTWTGFDNPTPLFGTTNGGDPASVIGPNGYFYEGYLIGGSYALGIAVSTNNGTSWATHVAYSVPNQDKEHVMVDKEPTSPYVNRVYYPWSDLNGSEAALVYSTDFGTTWSAYKNLSGTITPLGSAFAQGPNVQTGPNGEVYVCYAIYDANWLDGEDAIGFSKSTDGGATWTALRAYNQVNFGIRTSGSPGLPPKGMRTNSFPSMAVDRSGGPNNGNIYISWPQRGGVAPAGSDPDVVLITSTDGGATWTTPIRVNDDPISNGKDQLFPWCTVDQSTGQLMLVFYDSRNVVNTQAEVYMARSFDGGNTFENFLVSDHSFVLGPIPGFGSNYAGDYIGIAAYNDVAYPYWMDVSTGVAQGWMATVTFGPPCPVDPPANPNPANGTVDVPINLSNISWTNGAGTTQIEVWFGEAGNVVQVYSGTPTTSYSIPGTLSYDTDYNWRIVGLNDTCSVSGPLWAFTTEQDPNLVIDTLKIYPGNGTYWTGTCTASAKTDTSEVRGYGGGEVGWFVFDLSALPSGTIFNSMEFYGYVNLTNYPYWSLTPMGTIDPRTATASEISSYVNANSGQGTAYIFANESSTFTTGWHNYTPEANALTDLQNSLSQGWFACGMDERDGSATYYIEFDGWAQTNKPYIEVIYQYLVPVELTSFTANAAKDGVELKWSTATETNNQGFQVEKLNAAGTFEQIGYVAGFGTTTEPKAYSFTDSKLDAGTYTYRLKQIDFDGSFEYSDDVEVEVSIPAEYALAQNYPNPFNPSTTIKYSLAEDGFVKLAVYNMLGEEIAAIVNTTQKAGRYEVNFNASKLSSGVYVYRIEASKYTASKKLMLLK